MCNFFIGNVKIKCPEHQLHNYLVILNKMKNEFKGYYKDYIENEYCGSGSEEIEIFTLKFSNMWRAKVKIENKHLPIGRIVEFEKVKCN